MPRLTDLRRTAVIILVFYRFDQGWAVRVSGVAVFAQPVKQPTAVRTAVLAASRTAVRTAV